MEINNLYFFGDGSNATSSSKTTTHKHEIILRQNKYTVELESRLTLAWFDRHTNGIVFFLDKPNNERAQSMRMIFKFSIVSSFCSTFLDGQRVVCGDGQNRECDWNAEQSNDDWCVLNNNYSFFSRFLSRASVPNALWRRMCLVNNRIFS